MKWQLAIALGACCLLGADAPNEAARRDIEKWQGSWQATSMQSDGKMSSAEDLKKIKLTVTGTDYLFQNGGFSEHGSYVFRAAKDPKELDIVVGDGADKGKTYLVIYKIDADRLTICLDKANRRRPETFTGEAGSGFVLEVWQRAKP